MTFFNLRWTEAALATTTLLALVSLQIEHRRWRSIAMERDSGSSDMASLGSRLERSQSDLRLYSNIVANSRLSKRVTLVGQDLDSSVVNVRLDSSKVPILLYSIDPECASCLATLPFIKAVSRRSDCGVRVIGIAVNNWSELESLRKREDITFPILRQARGEAWVLFPINASPSTTLIGPLGRVQGWWRGLLNDTAKAEIDSLIAKSCRS